MAKTETPLANLVINYFPSVEVYEANKASIGADELVIIPQGFTVNKDSEGYYIEE